MGGDVLGEIKYVTSTTDGSPPWSATTASSATLQSNFVQTAVPLTIHDLRGKEKSVDLDTNALAILTYNGSIQEEFEGGSEAQQIYYHEIGDVLKKHLGASRVIVYHYTFRFRSQARTDEGCDYTHRNPAFYPHLDTDDGGVQETLVKALSQEDAEKAKQHRIQIINIWRPLGPHPITQKPLTICDYRSVDLDKDVHQNRLVNSTFNSTNAVLSRNAHDAHQWYYLSRMKSNEMFVFKMYDSKPDVAKFAFHTAFIDPTAPIPKEDQKSVEIRCIVIYDD